MVFCKACARDVPGNRGEDGFLSCTRCGKVLKFDNFSNEVTFVKNAAGQSKLAGSIVRSIDVENQSRQRLYAKAHEDLTNIKDGLGMGENMAMVDQALKYYRIAVERNFTKGRRTEQVQSVCLYIACRENRKPYLLIDFSNYLRINVFVLGAVFLQLCRVLCLTEHYLYQKLLDPSIFIHKYTASLAGGKNKDVTKTALAIIASMNRDWMQTGRMPGGIWGSAIYISALAHGINCSKEDILRLVHVCEATLMKRLAEFENTESGNLTIEELNAKVDELKQNAISNANSKQDPSFSGELLCEHKGTGKPSFALGLCRDCYANTIGLEGGADPPAFQRAEKLREKKSSTLQEEKTENNPVSCKSGVNFQSNEPHPAQHNFNKADSFDNPDEWNDSYHKTSDETDTLEDLDEAEVDVYVIRDKKEIELKTALWEELNREFLMEQEEKKAAAAAKGASNTEDGPKSRVKRRSSEAKNAEPPQSAAESCSRMLIRKRLSSKVNYEALEKLFADPETYNKKARVDSPLKESANFDEKDDCLEDEIFETANSESDYLASSLTTAMF